MKTCDAIRIVGLAFLSMIVLCNQVFAGTAAPESYGGRSLIIYVPSQLPAPESRALVVVLHGGLGNAQHIESLQAESGLNMDAVAERNGFIVAYLNGTPVTRFLGADKLGWNAGGGCCGQSAENNVDDIGYIIHAVAYLAAKYGVDRTRVYGIGHSNGAMMAQRLMCESPVFAAAVAISGPLNLQGVTCPDARGKRILAIHGADDRNVPVAGGQGRGLSQVAYMSEAYTQQVFDAAGATYTLDIVKGADHFLVHLDAAIQQSEGRTVAEKAAQFFGLMK